MDNFKHKKSLGQNFLHDENILQKISDAIDLKEDDLVIEIGPGQGALTKKLQSKKVNLVCYEIDERTKPFLSNIKAEKTEIIFDDFLKRNVLKDIENKSFNDLYIIANLPYYITTPIIKKIIEDKLPVKEMVLMVQKEVADRFSALIKTKDCNTLTIYLNYYFDIKKLFNVKNTCFNPVPKVDSAVVKFVSHPNKYNLKNEELFFKLVHDAFLQKRKNLRNNLKNYDLEKIADILKYYHLTLQNRAEEVPIKVFVDLANNIN